MKLESLVSRHQVGKNMDSICHEAIFTNCFCERLRYKGDAALASSAYLNGQDVRGLDAVVFQEQARTQGGFGGGFDRTPPTIAQ